MSGCVRHRWYASTGTTADIYPPCPYCRIAELETAVKIERKHAYGDGHMVASIELHGIIQERDARISELEAQVSAWQRWYDHWEFSNDYNLPDSPETEDQMK